jgi:mannose-6-phosphate isomerase-like protein (cupin superfamily)
VPGSRQRSALRVGFSSLFFKTARSLSWTIVGMRLVNHERDAMDLRTTPVHLGRGSRAKPVEGFAWDPEVLQAYSAAVAADGAEGRMVMIFDGDGLGDHEESHPAGDELVVCLTGSVTVTRDMAGVPERVLLGPGEATINPAGVWHAVDMEGSTSILAITATLGTEHRPRTGPRPTGRVGTPSPEEAP